MIWLLALAWLAVGFYGWLLMQEDEIRVKDLVVLPVATLSGLIFFFFVMGSNSEAKSKVIWRRKK